MGLRPGRCYNTKKDRANTRLAVSVPDRNYIGSAPGLKIRQFNMGNPAKEFNRIVDFSIEQHAQVRDNSLESARMLINRYMINKAGKDNFFLKLRIYPYHIMRENKQAQGAHADRIQTGMSHPFGKAIGRSARVRPGTKIFSIIVNEEHVEVAKEALRRAKSRITGKTMITVGKDVKSIGTKPRKFLVKEEEVAKKEETTTAAADTKEGKKDDKTAATPDAKKADAGKKDDKTAAKGGAEKKGGKK